MGSLSRGTSTLKPDAGLPFEALGSSIRVELITALLRGRVHHVVRVPLADRGYDAGFVIVLVDGLVPSAHLLHHRLKSLRGSDEALDAGRLHGHLHHHGQNCSVNAEETVLCHS